MNPQDLMTFKTKKLENDEVYNIVLKWDENDADYKYIHETYTKQGFEDELTFLLFVALHSDEYNRHIEDVTDINNFASVLGEYELVGYTDYGDPWHSIREINIEYIDSNKQTFTVLFPKIEEVFGTKQKFLDRINELIDEEFGDDFE